MSTVRAVASVPSAFLLCWYYWLSESILAEGRDFAKNPSEIWISRWAGGGSGLDQPGLVPVGKAGDRKGLTACTRHLWRWSSTYMVVCPLSFSQHHPSCTRLDGDGRVAYRPIFQRKCKLGLPFAIWICRATCCRMMQSEFRQR